MIRRKGALVVIAALGIGLSGCGAPAGLSGAPADPFNMRVVFGSSPGAVGSDVLVSLASQDAGSALDAGDPALPKGASEEEDANALRALAAGNADLTLVRADALVAAGAASLDALQAPAVVGSDEHAARIAADAEIREMAFADLPSIGLVGLAIAPGGLRRPFGYRQPLASAADWSGQAINVREGPGVERILSALSAVPDHSVDDRSARAADGRLRGIEVGIGQYRAVDLPAFLTTDVVLYERFDVVVVRKPAFDALSTGQRAELQTRVASAIASAVGARPSEAESLEAWCAQPGAAAVATGTAERAELTRLLATARDEIAKENSVAAGIVRRMTAIGEGLASQSLQPCAGIDVPIPVEPTGDQHALDGTWRVKVDADVLREAGQPADVVQANSGVWTFRIHGNEMTGMEPGGAECNMRIALSGEEVSIEWSVGGRGNCGGFSRGTYVRDGDTVRFTWDAAMTPAISLDTAFFVNGMVRIG